MAARQPHYSPKQIAEALHASESSVKRWCDRGAIPTVRTVGGHRRITLDGLQTFLNVSGRPLLDPHVLGLPVSRPAGHTLAASENAAQQRFREALAAGDEELCRQLVQQGIRAGRSRSEVLEELVTEAMHGMGEAWSCQEVDAYQERRGCEICIRLIHELRATLPALASDAPVAIGGTPAGDPYQLPTAMVELALREVGWNAVNLGHDLPTDSYLKAAQDYQPKLLWLSVSSIDNPAVFVAEQNRLAQNLADDVALLIGGRSLTDKLRPQLCYTAHCDSLRHLKELAAVMMRP